MTQDRDRGWQMTHRPRRFLVTLVVSCSARCRCSLSRAPFRRSRASAAPERDHAL